MIESPLIIHETFTKEERELFTMIKKLMNNTSTDHKERWIEIKNTRETGPIKEILMLRITVEVVKPDKAFN